MKIERPTKFVDSYLQHRLHPAIAPEQVQAALGVVIEDEGESGDGKATHHWVFLADGHECAVWDYRGLRWSAFGPREVFEQLSLEVIGGVEDAGTALQLSRKVAR